MIFPWIESSGCCQIVLDDLEDAVCQWEQAGVVRKAEFPEEANLLLIGGWINQSQAEHLKTVYSKMAKNKMVVAIGTCSLSGSVFESLEQTQTVDQVLPVNYRVTGCPPRWDDILKGISSAMNSGERERTVKDILNDTSKDVVF